jgi:flagellar basal-body rod modification protein FlgD
MPAIGRPVTNTENQYRQVAMAPRADENKKELLNKITGRREESIFKDSKDHNKMGKDEFLKLLTYQLQNQDPLNPMEQQKFSGELAQFAQLEQLTNLNDKYDNMNRNAGMQDKFFAASFLGKKVVTAGSTLKLNRDGEPADIMFSLDGSAKKLYVRIYDEKGNMIGQIEKENANAGSHQIKWNGTALDNTPAKSGQYNIQVLAFDEANQKVPAQTNAVGLVESVTFDRGEAVLHVDGKKVNLRDVISFHIAEKDIARDNDLKTQLEKSSKPLKAQAIEQFKQSQNSLYE